MSDERTTNRTPRIDKIDAAPPPENADPAWVSVLKAFNPLGAAAQAYARTLAYRIESKRLALEAERVQEQARAFNNIVDKTYELKMEQLRHRRIALERTFDLAEQQLDKLHLERMRFLEMVEVAHCAALDANAPMDARVLAKELVTVLTSQLPRFGEQANQNLTTLVQALPAIDMPKALLEPGR